MIPATLGEWTSEAIERLLTQGNFEMESFDYKETLPAKGIGDGKLRLRKECCAFANSEGGFLIFGIADDRTLSPQQRMVGFPPNYDFPVHFGEYPQQCRPSVQWVPSAVRVSATNPNLLHIIHIPHSWRGPHVVADDQKPDLWHFPKRTNKGIEPMSYEEVRMVFTGQYERRRKLALLRQELVLIRSQLPGFIIDPERADALTPADEISLNIIESLISDSYLVLEERPALLVDLGRVRRMARQINQAVLRYFQQAPRYSVGRHHSGLLGEHNNKMRIWTQQLQSDIDRCFEGLEYFGHR